MKYPKAFLIFRRRLAKAILKILGWKFRGQDPPTGRNQIIFINQVEGIHNSTQKKWMRHLTASTSYFLEMWKSTFSSGTSHMACISENLPRPKGPYGPWDYFRFSGKR